MVKKFIKEVKTQSIRKKFLIIFIFVILICSFLIFLSYTKFNYTGFSIEENSLNETTNLQLGTESTPNLNITENTSQSTNVIPNNLSLQEQNITNDISNSTVQAEGNATIQTIQYQAILGQPVKWTKKITPENIGNVTIEIPKEAQNIVINEINPATSQTISMTGGVISSQNQGNIFTRFFEWLVSKLTGRAIDNPQTENKKVEIELKDKESKYEVNYETPAPYAIESENENGKEIKITGLENINYKNVLSFTNLPESLNIKNISNVKIYWKENNSFIPVQKIKDTNMNGIYDYMEWAIPTLSSNQTFDIFIEIIKAEHLDISKNFISDIYPQVKSLDNIWSETINNNEYVRVTFEKNLTSLNDITIYPRVVNGTPDIEVYEENKTNKIAEFTNIISNDYNKVYLTNLTSSQDTFDLKIAGGSLQFDYITDPNITIGKGGAGDIAITPLTPTVFVFAYTNYTSNGLYFQLINPNGSTVLNSVYVDNISSAQAARVSVATINTTSFVIGWTNYSNSGEYRAIYLTNGSRIVGPSTTDGNIGTWAWDMALTSLGNSYAYCYINQVNSSVRTYVVNNEGNVATAINTLSGSMSPLANLSNVMDCYAINSTAYSVIYYDSAAGSVMFTTVNQTGNKIVERGAIDVTTLGKGGLVKTTGLNGNTTALVWYINATRRSNPQNISAMVKDANNNTIVATQLLVNNLGNWSRLAVATIGNASGDYLVVAWINSTVPGGATINGSIQWQVFSSSLVAAGPVVTVDPKANNRNPILYLQGEELSAATCQGTFALAYTNYSNFTVLRTYYINGTNWDGNNCSTVSDRVFPNVQINYPSNNTNWTSNTININYTASDNYALGSCWWSNDSRQNATIACGTNITTVIWSEGVHNISVWANDTAGNMVGAYVTFTVDTTPPSLNITYPAQNNTNTTNANLNINFTVSDASTRVDSCWFSNDSFGVNYSLGSNGFCDNITNISWSVGTHKIRIYANDTLNNLNLSSITFNYAASVMCSPVLNADWLISDSQICDGIEVTTGTGFIDVLSSGLLYLINGANVTTRGLNISASGNKVFINKGSSLRV